MGGGLFGGGLGGLFGGGNTTHTMQDHQQHITAHYRAMVDAQMLQGFPQGLQQQNSSVQSAVLSQQAALANQQSSKLYHQAMQAGLGGLYQLPPKFPPVWVVQYHTALESAKLARFSGEEFHGD